jgi:serine/threonine-protein kinase
VHRDLKLSNLMLGDFGEVYVLDWGVAKVVGAEEFMRDPITGIRSDINHTNDDMLGTLGYMAPEQILDSTGVDARADIYALGVILFMLLTRERLHTQKNRADIANSTHTGADARASVRAPNLNIPPELDAICVKATAVDPDQRYSSARALHDEVQRFLEGDRDMRLRVEVAARHLNEAKRVLASTDDEVGGATERRRRALQETARALAVSPESEEAAALMSSLMLNPPEQVPPEVELETAELSERELATTGAAGAAALIAVVVFGFLQLTWLGVRSWAAIGSFLGLIGLAALASLTAKFTRHRVMPHVVSSVFFSLAMVMMSRIAGPFSFPPLLTVAYIIFISGTHGLGRWRLVCLTVAFAGVMIPAGLEVAGVVTSQFVFEDGSLRIVESAIQFRGTRVIPALVFTILAVFAACLAVVWHYSSVDTQTRRRLLLMAWHLRQLAPRRELNLSTGEDTANDVDTPAERGR